MKRKKFSVRDVTELKRNYQIIGQLFYGFLLMVGVIVYAICNKIEIGCQILLGLLLLSFILNIFIQRDARAIYIKSKMYSDAYKNNKVIDENVSLDNGKGNNMSRRNNRIWEIMAIITFIGVILSAFYVIMFYLKNFQWIGSSLNVIWFILTSKWSLILYLYSALIALKRIRLNYFMYKNYKDLYEISQSRKNYYKFQQE